MLALFGINQVCQHLLFWEVFAQTAKFGAVAGYAWLIEMKSSYDNNVWVEMGHHVILICPVLAVFLVHFTPCVVVVGALEARALLAVEAGLGAIVIKGVGREI